MAEDTGETPVRKLMAAMAAADPWAIGEFVDQYGEYILSCLRRLMAGRDALRRDFDSGDLLQQLLFNFVRQTQAGKLTAESAEDLKRILYAMARNQYFNTVRYQHAQHRDVRRLSAVPVEDLEILDTGSAGLSIEEKRALVGKLRAHLPLPQQQFLKWRMEGWSWARIAMAAGGEVDALRQWFFLKAATSTRGVSR